MKKSTLSKLGMLVAGGWLASGTAWAAQPIEPPQSGPQTGGIPQCQADLADAQSFPATGQTTCWYFDDATQQYVADPECTDPLTDGQDGDIRAGAELSYTDTGLTIIDNSTKLEWMKQDDNGGDCASSPGYRDKDCTFTWDGAFAFVDQLNEDNYAGGGWRVPNRKELDSILNLENFSPAVSAEFNTGCEAGCTVDDPVNACSCTAGIYWSSTSFAHNPSNAWVFSFFVDGGVFASGKSGGKRVRAVRGGLID